MYERSILLPTEPHQDLDAYRAADYFKLAYDVDSLAELRDLIDSGVNQIEDGYSKTPTDGLRLTSVGGSLRVLSLYENLSAQDPSWVIVHGKDNSSLHFKRGKAQKDAGISFSPEGRMGVAVTFIAILELLRESVIEVVQSDSYAPLHVRAASKVRLVETEGADDAEED